MKLLIVTQRVDRRDPVLGFFHRWIEEFALQCEHVTVIGQSVTDHGLPENVTVLSLGKERGSPKLMQMLRYRWYLFRERANYDAIFIHMTPIWAVLGWRAVFILRKRMYLWYEARGTRWPLRIALIIVRKAFSASAYGMPIATKKSVVLGHGIDTNAFAPNSESRDANMLITVGRITPSKHLDKILGAFVQLPENYSLHILGEPRTPADQQFEQALKRDLEEHGLGSRVHMHPIEHMHLPVMLQTAGLFLHASTSGLDKAVLEAMACGCLVVSSNPSLQELLPAICRADADTLVEAAQRVLALSASEKQGIRTELRKIVAENHSLHRLIKNIVSEMSV